MSFHGMGWSEANVIIIHCICTLSEALAGEMKMLIQMQALKQFTNPSGHQLNYTMNPRCSNFFYLETTRTMPGWGILKAHSFWLQPEVFIGERFHLAFLSWFFSSFAGSPWIILSPDWYWQLFLEQDWWPIVNSHHAPVREVGDMKSFSFQ